MPDTTRLETSCLCVVKQEKTGGDRHAYNKIYSISDPNQTFYYGQANEEGRFKMRLPDGEYVLDNIYLYDHTSFMPASDFTIMNGELYVNGEKLDDLEVNIPSKTLFGKVYDGDHVVNSGYVYVSGVGDQLRSYSSWIQEDGTYQLRLPDGEFELDAVDSPTQGYVYFQKFFTIVDGKLVVDGAEVESWDIHLEDGTPY